MALKEGSRWRWLSEVKLGRVVLWRVSWAGGMMVRAREAGAALRMGTRPGVMVPLRVGIRPGVAVPLRVAVRGGRRSEWEDSSAPSFEGLKRTVLVDRLRLWVGLLRPRRLLGEVSETRLMLEAVGDMILAGVLVLGVRGLTVIGVRKYF